MSDKIRFTKENIDKYFNELAKALKKQGIKMPIEIIVVGGASILLNYDFRISSMDIDVDYSGVGSVFKECATNVGDKFGLPNGWVNSDFRKTNSYSDNLYLVSKPYKTFCQILNVRTINAEYLVAMKLVAGRKYKNDLSDVVGIMYEQQVKGEPLSYEKVDKAVKELYGDWSNVSDETRELFLSILKSNDLKQLYLELSSDELQARETLIEIDKQYPDVVKESNIDEIIKMATNKKKRS